MSLVLLCITASLALKAPVSELTRIAVLTTAPSVTRTQVIVQQYGDADPHGDDPHGHDPHDEQHDLGLKANSMDNDRAAPSDVYGGRMGANTQHPLDNMPPR